MAHALLSPSSFHRWSVCAGAPAMEYEEPDTASEYADEGTAAHFLASECLTTDTHPSAHVGKHIYVKDYATFESSDFDDDEKVSSFKVDIDMAAYVNKYVQAIRDRVESYKLQGCEVELRVEQAVPISHLTGEEGATGTADAIVIATHPDGWMGVEVHDLKYGRGVEVEAENNGQLMMYAHHPVGELALLYDVRDVVLAIHQPRLRGTASEWSISADELLAWGHGEVAPKAAQCHIAFEFRSNWIGKPDSAQYLKPSTDGCKFCKAKARCPVLTREVLSTVTDDFVDLTQPEQVVAKVEAAMIRAVDNKTLGTLMQAIDLIEDWCKAVRGKVESEMLAGREVPGFKLVEGRQGPRKWRDETEAEQTMKSMRLKQDEMYEFSIISPTTAEKLAKDGKIGQRQWPKLLELITRTDGKPSVAPVSDKRPALVLAAPEADFADLTGSDLV